MGSACDNCGRGIQEELSLGIQLSGRFCSMECYWSEVLDEDKSRLNRGDSRSLSLGSRTSEPTDGTKGAWNRRTNGPSVYAKKAKTVDEEDTNAMYLYHVENDLSSTFRMRRGLILL
uniref:FLZ-type domain-containing protein n=1 Tax=Rhodosorus marinus TaxID=101924 RepID=A0A7S3E843_9RHOD|mmetsp:Transcript_16373/g.67690  ORF Transcript_16373/g.67690 Transcript_16373/m.67690 type:complete len:117 (+) Transcript_16373:235-585(+)|eukprot:CAMPEP_0113953926 /NCGR_PEP_ID=MMETSP0011_2-20120614/132_1 /TAXON_ID=101924 /ORGANISM="Rhodosorus marinus" /LENGTH=116 /DNA_ID=CAMNT_0000962725 /DNA_START=121 /DNA_END=471 /DNA_ORIENTATION=+ /assembly_acc=CAM_ASM_000156